MNAILIKKIHTLVTMDGDAPPLSDVDLFIRNNKIAAIGKNLKSELADTHIIDGSHCAVYPGFINTHHHFSQTLTRNVPAVQNAKLFDWLTWLYEVWKGLTPDAIEVATKVALGELLLSGCTTASDHFYLFPRTASSEFLDCEIDVAREIGIRFHPCRGSMSNGRSQGGLPPDSVVQTHDEILADCARVIDKYHDPDPYSMCRIALAPCSPFSVTTELLRDTAELARANGVRLHTHLCETKDEEAYCLEKYKCRPLDYMDEAGWLAADVWYAHGIYFNDDEIARIAAAGAGIAHCPASNLRLGSGICPVPKLLDAGVTVGLAVDGSASNDSSSMLREMQLALLIHRVGTAVDAMPPRMVLEMATRAGSRILGQPEIGRLVVGSAADIAMFRLDRIEFAGAMSDPASAILFCGSGVRAEYTIVNGRVLVEKGELTEMDEDEIFNKANKMTSELLKGAI